MHDVSIIVHDMEQEPLESHGLRLPPKTWRKIEKIADRRNLNRSTWLRQQIEAVLVFAESMLTESETVLNVHGNGASPSDGVHEKQSAGAFG